MNIKPEQVEGILKSLPPQIRGVVIYGSNEGMISTLSQQFVKAVSPDVYDAFHVSYLEMSDISSDVGTLYAEYNAQSLMGGRRVVVIKEATNLLTKTAERDALLQPVGQSAGYYIVFFENKRLAGSYGKR